MAYVSQEAVVVPQAIADTSTTVKVPLGTIVNAYDTTYGGGEFVYLKGVASCALGSWVTYNADDNTTALLAANAIGPVAVAMAATTASYYGWFQIGGKAIGKCLTQLASNNRVWITGTGGSVDDASVAGDGVNNAKTASGTTVGTFIAEFEIHRPWVNDRTSFS